MTPQLRPVVLLGRAARAARLARAGLVLAALGCSFDSPGQVEIPEADQRRFVEEVYPVLLASCAYTTCHGDPRRPFLVYGPGRTRLDDSLDAYDPVTAEELAISYTRARSMLVSPDGPRRSPLLRKPLAVSAGGAEHAGDDPWGDPVFASKRDPRYVALFYWAIGRAPERVADAGAGDGAR